MAADAPLPDDARPLIPDDSPPLLGGESQQDDARAVDPVAVNNLLGDIEGELAPAFADAVTLVRDTIDVTAAQLLEARRDVGTALADYIGMLDGSLTSSGIAALGIMDRLVSDAEKPLTLSRREMLDAGINYPESVELMAQLVATDPTEWIAVAVPGMETKDPPGGGADVPGDTPEPTEPTPPYMPTGPVSGSPPIYTPPDTTPVVNNCPGGKWVPNPFLGQPNDPYNGLEQLCVSPDAPPPPPAEPPPPTSPPIEPAPFPTGDAGDKCCPPAVVNVYAAPVTTTGTPIPPPTGGSSTTTIYTAPPPPPPPPPLSPDPRLPPITADADCRSWDVSDICQVAFGSPGTTEADSPGGGGAAGGSSNKWLERFVKGVGTSIEIAIPGLTLIAAGKQILSGHSGIAQFGVTHDIGVSLAKDLMNGLTGSCVENKGTVIALSTMLAGVNWAESITGAPLRYLAQSNIYSFQFLNPQFLIGQSDDDNLYLRGYIDDEQWTCITKANGNLPGWHRSARDAKQALLTPDQLVQLWRRGLMNQAQLNSELNRNGFVTPGYWKGMRDLSEQPLTPSDLVSGMKRDVFDEGVVKKYEYDKDFAAKFNGKAQEWAYWQGYSAEQFKYLWRAHWVIPSNTQLYEMFHRLRPDRQEVVDAKAANAALPAGADVGEITPDPPVVTVDDVKEALEINDQAPAWIDRLIAISYHPITMTDATRAFMIGHFDSKKLKASFRDNGYNDADAQTLTEFWQFETNKRIRSQSGVLTPRKVIALYKIGAFSRNDARQLLIDIFPNGEQLDKLLDLADKETEAEETQVRAKAIERAFITGELDEPMAQLQLDALGIDAQAARRTVRMWNAKRINRSKEVTGLILCKWAWHGLIGPFEHRERLMRLGYPEKDANRIASVCEKDNAVKRAKLAAKDAKKVQGDQIAGFLKQIKQLRELKEELEKFFKEHGYWPLPEDITQEPGGNSESGSGGGG